MHEYLSKRAVALFFIWMGLSLNSCGKKSDGSSETYAFLSRLAMGHQTLSYSQTALASTIKTPGSTSLDHFLDLAAQDPALPSCSLSGEPWSRSGVMQAVDEKYVPTLLYCEVNSKTPQKTLAGSLDNYRRILCEVERTIGAIEYTEEGKEYLDRVINATEACDWSEDLISTWQPLTAKVTAYAPSSGNWQKRIKIEVPQKIMFDFWYNITETAVSFKMIEEWNQAYPPNGEAHDAIASTATGSRGIIFSVDASNGIMRTESIDTYWGKRFRYYAKGSLDASTGKFTAMTDGQAIVSNFDRKSSGFSGTVATMDGSDASGFYYAGTSYSSSTPSDIRGSGTTVNTKTECSMSGGCSGQTHVTFGTDSGDFDFLMVGAAWDGQINSRSAGQSWLVGAGLMNFASVNKSKTL